MYWVFGTLIIGAIVTVWIATHNAMDYDPSWEDYPDDDRR